MTFLQLAVILILEQNVFLGMGFQEGFGPSSGHMCRWETLLTLRRGPGQHVTPAIPEGSPGTAARCRGQGGRRARLLLWKQ